MSSAERSSTQKLLPLYLSVDGNIFGVSEGPLQLKRTLLVEQARFSLQFRIKSMFSWTVCSSARASVNDWLEGEQLLIKCSRHSFKHDGYIAICPDHSASKASEYNKQEANRMHAYQKKSHGNIPPTLSAPMLDDHLEPAPLVGKERYKTITVPFAKDQSKDVGMLFRLCLKPPSSIQTLDMHQKASATSPEPVEPSTFEQESEIVIRNTPEQESVGIPCTETVIPAITH